VRTRLLLVLLPLLALLLVAFESALARSYAERLTQQRLFELVGVANGLAARADAVLRDDEGFQRLGALLAKNEAIHDSALLVVDRNDDVLAPADAEPPASAAALHAAAAAALEGQAPRRPHTAWPWRHAPFVVAAPVGQETRPVGAVIAVASTAHIRAQITQRLLVLGGAWLAILALATLFCLLPLARWILRPVAELTAAAQRLAAGKSDARAVTTGGPPELLDLAVTFNAMVAAVSRALEREREFAADASHQLRNPLTALRLRLDSLALYVTPAGERELRSALDETERLSTTIDVLLRLARAEATAAEMCTLDVTHAARERVDAWLPTCVAAGTSLSLEANGSCLARCDPEALDQVLDALLDNALKFGDGSDVDVTVEANEGHVRVRVRDHGSGLTDAERGSAAERFWRSPRHQNVDGSGLGIAIARTLLEPCGGRLELVDAQPGLAAEVVLPADQPPASR
jgi:signal transduction histidine kinase